MTLFYSTDPICSYCFAFEPFWRKIELALPVDKKILMGGLLPGWAGFADAGHGINNPKDVAAHYKEVGKRFLMPLSGDVWLKDPLDSSYPVSAFYLLVEKYYPKKAQRFLRQAREALFVFDKNIAKTEVLAELLDDIDASELLAKMQDEGLPLLKLSIEKSRSLRAAGFPSLTLSKGDEFTSLSTFKDINYYLEALKNFSGNQSLKLNHFSLDDLFDISPRLYFREIEILFDIDSVDVEAFIKDNLKQNYEIKSYLSCPTVQII